MKHRPKPSIGHLQIGGLATWTPHKHHTLVVGATGSGKTVLTYSMLASIAADPCVQIIGCDPSSLTLAPFERDEFPERIALGTSDMSRHAEVLERAVALMDRRIAALFRAGIDKWQTSPHAPTIVTVLEEYAGLLAAAEAEDSLTPHGTPSVKKRILAAAGRLLRESRKAGLTVVTIIQRPDATVMGGGDRAQYSRRIAMRMDNADGVRMVFEGIDAPTVEALTVAKPGVGLIQEPGQPAEWFRAYHLAPYSRYSQYVRNTYEARPVDGFDHQEGH